MDDVDIITSTFLDALSYYQLMEWLENIHNDPDLV